MNKEDYFHKAIEQGELTLAFPSAAAARLFRATLYHFRRSAAINDRRALQVVVKLKDNKITLTYTPAPEVT